MADVKQQVRRNFRCVNLKIYHVVVSIHKTSTIYFGPRRNFQIRFTHLIDQTKHSNDESITHYLPNLITQDFSSNAYENSDKSALLACDFNYKR